MSQSHTAVTQATPQWLPASRAARVTLSVIAGSALLAISAHVSVPLFITPVPFTLQPMAVLLLGLLLDPAVAFATLAAYLLEGAAGLPVFAPVGLGGAFALLGPSAGFLWAYPLAVVLVSKLYRSGRAKTFTWAALAATAGAIVYFTGGALWFAVTLHQSLGISLKMTVWPFVAGDALKVVLAAAIVTGLYRLRTRTGVEA
ncbi:MAG TPA: biotin transporter BioY [Acidobacteriaceae bacterium]|nr:biotin transporter BioY [Acidobacteriaceae bacterium]